MSESSKPPGRSEKELFFEVLEKSTPAERARFLDGACGSDPVLRGRMETLLADHFQKDEFMREPVVEAASQTRRSMDPALSAGGAPTSTIGRYKLLERLGEGGFGEVWMAEQREPVRRRVALKIIKLGMDSRQIVARFEAERQALAMMDHPNIARIFDAGTTGREPEAGSQKPEGNASDSNLPTPDSRLLTPAAGRPYFVMELVRGIKITEYCDQNQLTTRQRLELFIQVCQAIQHAHQKGIIHRDIKPSNILVTLHDGVPVPKVIDFGIAKATQGELTDKTVFTQFEQFIGTPAYISPEQAEMSGLDIDTRADIYSLGVLLYELLVGRTPFDAREMMKGGLDGLRRTIREKEPVRPSTRLTQELMAARAGRPQSPQGLTVPTQEEVGADARRRQRMKEQIGVLRGDLDWIVMKCLEKDRMRRYDTANGLAADIQRYLASEPVVARPPSVAYTLQKAFRRNRLAFTAAAAVALALLAGTAVSTWQAVQAMRSRNAAEAARSAEASQRLAAQRALQQEAAERHRAEASEQVAQGLLYVANMNLIRQAWIENNVGRIRQLLDDTAGFTGRGFEWYFWLRQAHLDLRTFRGHAARVWSADFSPDGRRIVTTSDDGTATIWETASGEKLLTLPGHADWVRSAVFSPDGSRVVTGSKDYIARVWDAGRGVEILRLHGHRAAIRTVKFFPDGRRIVTASQDGTARIWEAETGRSLQVLRGHSNWVLSAACSPDGRRVVTAGDDDTARIWNVDDGRELLRLTGHDGNVRTAAFSPDSRRVVTASEDKTARVWDAGSGQLQLTLRGHQANVFSASFSPDGQRLVTTGRDQTVRIWEAGSGRELNQFKGHASEIYTAVFSMDGRLVLTASDDATAKVWDAASLSDPQRLEQGGRVFAVAISPDSQRIATGGEGGKIRIWSAPGGELLLTLPIGDTVVQAMAFSPDGQRLATGDAAGNTRLWLAANGRLLFTCSGHSGAVNSVAFSADGKRILTAGGEGKVKVWGADDGHEQLSLPQMNGQAFSARFSPDGSRIVSSYSSGARVSDALTGAETVSLINSPQRFFAATFSPDGRWVLATSEDKSARVWNASTGEPRRHLAGHTLGVLAASYSPDGRRIVTGSYDLSAKVWDADTGQELLTLAGHKGAVSSVAFSPDGRRIVTGSLDGAALVWTAAPPEQVAAWQQEKNNASNRVHVATPRLLVLASEPVPPAALPPGLISRWLLLAPMKTPALDAATVLEREQIPSEARLRPRAGESARFSERNLTWEPFEQATPLLDFNAFVGQVSSPGSVAYAVSYLVLDAPQSGAAFHITGDDEYKVFLNGRLLHRSDPNREYVLNEEKVGGVELAAGTNTLVFKVFNDIERWLGSIRVLDAGGQAIPGLRVTLEPGAPPQVP